jgi:hypothetical protein
MKDAILNNPVRLYGVISALLALLAYYVDSLPVPLLLSLLAAILGVGGEVARGQVIPLRKHVQGSSTAEMVPANVG